MLMFFIALISGFMLWSCLYGTELLINGIMDLKFKVIFNCLYEEFLWIVPGGLNRKIAYLQKQDCFDDSMSYAKKVVLAKRMLPGIGHFVIMHIIIPSSPLMFYIIGKMS